MHLQSKKSGEAANTICPCAQISRAPAPKHLGSQNIRPGLRKRACAPSTNSERLCVFGSPSGWGAGTQSLALFSPTPPALRTEMTTHPRSTEAGFISAPFFLSRKRLVGTEGKRRDKLPRVQYRQWNREMRRRNCRCLLTPQSRLVLWYLLHLESCCYPRTWPGWYWVSAERTGRVIRPG